MKTRGALPELRELREKVRDLELRIDGEILRCQQRPRLAVAESNEDKAEKEPAA